MLVGPRRLVAEPLEQEPCTLEENVMVQEVHDLFVTQKVSLACGTNRAPND